MAVNIEKTKYYQYAADVIDGKVVAGELIQLACSRIQIRMVNGLLHFYGHIPAETHGAFLFAEQINCIRRGIGRFKGDTF